MPLTELPRRETDASKIYDHIKALASLEADTFKEAKNKKGDIFNLREHQPGIKRLIKCFRGIEKTDIESFPKQKLTDPSFYFDEAISNVERFFNRLTNPDFTSENVNSVGHDLPTIYADAYEKMGWIKLHSTSQDDSRVQQLVSDAENLLKKANDAQNDWEKLSQTLRDELNKQGISKEAHPFHLEAENFGRSQKLWGRLLGFSILLIIFVGLALFLWFKIPTENLSLTLSHLLSRLSVLGALWYATIFCSRNYRAAAHGKIINERCRNALNSFEVFLDGTSDPAVKNAVLQRATETIFSHQTTGFGQREKCDKSETNFILKSLAGGFTEKD